MHVNCSRKIIISSKYLLIFYWMKINKYLQIFGKYMTNWFEIKHNLTFFLGFLFSYVLYFEGKTRRKWLTDMTLTWGMYNDLDPRWYLNIPSVQIHQPFADSVCRKKRFSHSQQNSVKTGFYHLIPKCSRRSVPSV